MAVGALFMSLRPGYTSGDLSAYLFGSIVTVTHGDVVALAILTAAIMAGALLWLRPVMYVAFDRDFARSRGIPTRVISYAMAALVAVTIVSRSASWASCCSSRCSPCPSPSSTPFPNPTAPSRSAPAGRRGRQCGRTGRKLQFRSSARGGHNIYPHPYAYYSKTITFASEKSRSRRMKTIHKLVLKAYLGPMVLTFFIVMFV